MATAMNMNMNLSMDMKIAVITAITTVMIMVIFSIFIQTHNIFRSRNFKNTTLFSYSAL